MSTSRRPLFSCFFYTIGAASLAFSAAAQSPTSGKSSILEKSAVSKEPRKPVRTLHTVLTNYSITRLAEKPTIPPTRPTVTAQPETEAVKEPSAPTSDLEQRKREIATLEKLLKEKQQRVELLMRLFATDEQSFLKDPLNHNGDATTQERLRYEQDELLWESAEIARLRASLDALKDTSER